MGWGGEERDGHGVLWGLNLNSQYIFNVMNDDSSPNVIFIKVDRNGISEYMKNIIVEGSQPCLFVRFNYGFETLIYLRILNMLYIY